MHRLPTVDEINGLCGMFSRWNNTTESMDILTENGDTISFKAFGELHPNKEKVSSSYGNGVYWTGDKCKKDEYNGKMAYYLTFNRHGMFGEMLGDINTYKSVRLVSDEPFDGAIECCGVYWKPDNEPGLHTYEEAVNIANNDNIRYIPIYEPMVNKLDMHLQYVSLMDWLNKRGFFKDGLQVDFDAEASRYISYLNRK